MTPLARELAARITAEGPISVADYMAECLLHPAHGYYTTRDPFGAAGDFTTAPEISQMFGELVGLALAQAHVAGLDEHTGGAQVARAAETAVTARQEHVHGGARSVARCQSSLHGSASSLFLCDA